VLAIRKQREGHWHIRRRGLELDSAVVLHGTSSRDSTQNKDTLLTHARRTQAIQRGGGKELTTFLLQVEGHKPFTGTLEKIIQTEATLWVVRGDEELAMYNHKSRTGAEDWTGVGPWTPSVFRFEKTPRLPASDYRVNVTPLNEAIRKLNLYQEKKINYLYSPETGMFNGTGFPKQQYLVMSGCVLEQTAIEGNYLKFRTLQPTSDVTFMTSETHPQFIHTWDLVGWKKNLDTGKWETLHKPMTPQGIIKHFCVTIEGCGYIPLEWVKPL
jgi:hypothetical protein